MSKLPRMQRWQIAQLVVAPIEYDIKLLSLKGLQFQVTGTSHRFNLSECMKQLSVSVTSPTIDRLPLISSLFIKSGHRSFSY